MLKYYYIILEQFDNHMIIIYQLIYSIVIEIYNDIIVIEYE